MSACSRTLHVNSNGQIFLNGEATETSLPRWPERRSDCSGSATVRWGEHRGDRLVDLVRRQQAVIQNWTSCRTGLCVEPDHAQIRISKCSLADQSENLPTWRAGPNVRVSESQTRPRFFVGSGLVMAQATKSRCQVFGQQRHWEFGSSPRFGSIPKFDSSTVVCWFSSPHSPSVFAHSHQ